MIWRSAASLLVRGADVILDDGFFFRDNRKQHIKLANELGVQAKTHYLSAPADALRFRIEGRNAHLPKYNFRIDRGMLDVFIGLFEIPSVDEGAPLVVNFALGTLGVSRLEARACVANGRGNGALRKIGAVQEGVLRRSFFKDGRHHDQILWSILAEEWRDSKASFGPSIIH